MNKIPVPVMIAIAVFAVFLLGFAVFKSAGKSGGDNTDVQAINQEILKNNPKDAPDLPPDTSHVAMPARGKR